MAKPLAGLFTVFLPLSFFTIGGGQAIIAEVQRQSVTVHHWMTNSEFAELFAVSRMAPGPGSLYITLIGWDVAGPAGAVVATVAIFGPSLVLTYIIARIWSPHGKARWQRSLEAGLRPVAAGMVLASVYVLLMSLNGGWWARGIALSSTAALLATRVHPFLVLAAGSLAFLGISHFIPG